MAVGLLGRGGGKGRGEGKGNEGDGLCWLQLLAGESTGGCMMYKIVMQFSFGV